MTTITFAGPDLVTLLQGVAQANVATDAATDAAVKADFDAQLATAQKAHDDAVAKAAADLDTAAAGIAQAEADKVKAITAERHLRDAKIQAGIAFAQSGQPVTIELPDATAAV